MHAERQAQGLDNRLATAETKTRGSDASERAGQTSDQRMKRRSERRLTTCSRTSGWTGCSPWHGNGRSSRHTHDVGRGRGSATRAQRMREHIRSHITRITRQDGAIQALRQRFGWKAFATNAPQERLSLADAVLCYRNAYRIERIFNRLKSRVHIAPLDVKRDDQIEGLTYLLTLGIRVLTVMEFVLRRSLQHDQVRARGFTPGKPAKAD